MDLRGKVVLITGAGGGLGRSYALAFAREGATVVVNDLARDRTTGESYADRVVAEIKRSGGSAAADYNSALDGDKIVNAVLARFGRIDALVNNAGILRDRSFLKMSDKQWNDVIQVHLYATRNVCKAAWAAFRKQKYGRIVNISSVNGLYGQFGQTNYSAAKAAIVGFTKALAKEGKKYDIRANIVAPGAGGDSKMTKTIIPPEMYKAWLPEYVTPIVVLLGSRKCPCTGKIFEAGGGYFGEVKWQRSKGLYAPLAPATYSPADLLRDWDKVVDFQGAHYPEDLTGIPPQMAQIAKKLQSKL